MHCAVPKGKNREPSIFRSLYVIHHHPVFVSQRMYEYIFLSFTVLPALYVLNLGLKWQRNIAKARKSGIEPVTVGRECLPVIFLFCFVEKYRACPN